MSKTPKALSVGEETLAMHLKAHGVVFVREFRFNPDRKWRVDFLVVMNDFSVAIEVEGGHWMSGRHNRPSSFEAELEKYNDISARGYVLLRFTTGQVERGEAIDCILKVLGI